MKKKSSDSPKNTLKRQLVSGGIYIALSAVAVAVTVNTVMSMMPDGNIPNIDESLDNTEFQLPSLPKLDMSDITSLPQTVTDEETSVSHSPSGISAEITEEMLPDGTFLSDFSSLPDVTEMNVGGDLISDADELQTAQSEVNTDNVLNEENGVFLKPCEGFVTMEHSSDIPVYSPTFSDYRTHTGVDIAADKGSLVKAVKSGVVTEIYVDDLYGNTLKLETPEGYCFVYSNLSDDFPEGIDTGAEISIGTVVASVGDSAISEAAQESHLHFEAYYDGKSTDPQTLIDF